MAYSSKSWRQRRRSDAESSSNLGNSEVEVEDLLTRICDPEHDGGKEYNKEARSAQGKWIAYSTYERPERQGRQSSRR